MVPILLRWSMYNAGATNRLMYKHVGTPATWPRISWLDWFHHLLLNQLFPMAKKTCWKAMTKNQLSISGERSCIWLSLYRSCSKAVTKCPKSTVSNCQDFWWNIWFFGTEVHDFVPRFLEGPNLTLTCWSKDYFNFIPWREPAGCNSNFWHFFKPILYISYMPLAPFQCGLVKSPTLPTVGRAQNLSHWVWKQRMVKIIWCHLKFTKEFVHLFCLRMEDHFPKWGRIMFILKG